MFALMSFLHVFFAFLFMDGKYWGEFTAFGDMIVMFSFIIIQFIVLRKHFKSPEE
ncbi:intracellular septation protein A [compost metagenome]